MSNGELFFTLGASVASASIASWFTYDKMKRRIALLESTRTLAFEMFEHMDEAVAILAEDGTIHYANKTMRRLTGISDNQSNLALDAWFQVEIKNQRYRLDEMFKKAIIYRKDNNKMSVIPQCKVTVHDEKEPIPATLFVKRIKKTSLCPKSECYAIIVHDLRSQNSEQDLLHTHQLSGLPNEIQAKKDLHKIFSQSHLEDTKIALILLEIDQVSQIRSMIGHEQAEKQLAQIAHYLNSEAQKIGGHTYHMFMNTFMVVIPKVYKIEEVNAFCLKIEKQLKDFYEVDRIKLHMSASIGIAVYPNDGSSLTILDNAFKALNEAQKNGYGQICFFHDIVDHSQYNELELYHSLHSAIENNEFEIYYQPIVRVGDLEVVSAEALVRWKHPKYGYIPPSIFVPMLEKSGYIVELGRYTLKEVLKQMKRWEVFKFKPVQVSINISMLELESEGFAENVEAELKANGIYPDLLKFEITEGIAMRNEAIILQRLEALKKIGVSIALDDFGTGYTSFSYLKKIPAEWVKIDRSMVLNILESKEDERIVRAMIELGHNLDMKVVVEGIENEWMFEKLRELKCDYVQGYLFNRPIPAYEFQEYIRFEKSKSFNLDNETVDGQDAFQLKNS